MESGSGVEKKVGYKPFGATTAATRQSSNNVEIVILSAKVSAVLYPNFSATREKGIAKGYRNVL